MKKLTIITIIFLREILVVGQNQINNEYYQDTIWLESGETVACKIINEKSKSITVNYINVNNDNFTKKFSKSKIVKLSDNPFNVRIEKKIIQYKNNSKKKPKIYKTWISLTNESYTFNGILFEIYDSTIAIVTTGYNKDSAENNLDISIIPVKDIGIIRVHRANNPGGVIGSALLGGTLGMIVGVPIWASIDMASDSPYNENEPKIAACVTFGIGAGIGILIHSYRKKRFWIDGSIDNYKILLDRFKKYSLVREK